MAHQQPEKSDGCINPSASIIPISISDKAILVDEICLPSLQPRRVPKKVVKGQWTWLMAALALPTVIICLVVTLILMAEPIQMPKKLGLVRTSPQLPRKNIFILDMNEENFPSIGKLKTLEQCLKKNKHNEVYQITLNKYIDQYNNFTALNKLKKKYSNFHFLFQNVLSYFRGSIFEGTIDNDTPTQLLFKAQLLILWRYSGIVLSSNWIPLKAIEKAVYTRDDRTLTVGGYNGHIGLISSPNNCNAKLFDIMTQIKKFNATENMEMDIVDRSMLHSRSGYKKVGFPQLCNNNTINQHCFLMKSLDCKSQCSSMKSNDIIEKSSTNPIIVKRVMTPGSTNNIDQSSYSIPTIFRRYFIYT